jgi:hypothetical protein
MNTCLVCGYPGLEEPPRAPSGGGSYEICPSCGFQYGVDDDDRGTDYVKARAAWVGRGSAWWSRGQTAPADWDAGRQLSALVDHPGPAAVPDPEGEE